MSIIRNFIDDMKASSASNYVKEACDVVLFYMDNCKINCEKDILFYLVRLQYRLKQNPKRSVADNPRFMEMLSTYNIIEKEVRRLIDLLCVKLLYLSIILNILYKILYYKSVCNCLHFEREVSNEV